MTYIHYIGIDISKNFFDVACLSAKIGDKAEDRPHRTQQFPNNPQGFLAFMRAYAASLPHALVVMEATGGYETALIVALLQQHIRVHRGDPLTAKYFIRSLGKRAKTDALDALALARYGQERHATLPPVILPDEEQQELIDLTMRRGDLVAMKVMEQQRLKHSRYAKLKEYVQPLMENIQVQIALIEQRIHSLIENSQILQRKMEVLTSVKGVGVQTATTLLAAMPELGTLTRRQAASLAGCAPHPKDSGKHRGYRRTGGGRQQVKRALFMAAMSACRYNQPLKDFYEKLLKNGKKPMVALVAVMRKLITILNAKIRDANLQTSW